MDSHLPGGRRASALLRRRYVKEPPAGRRQTRGQRRTFVHMRARTISRTTLVAAFAALLLLGSVGCSSSTTGTSTVGSTTTPAPSTAWPTYHRDPARTGLD